MFLASWRVATARRRERIARSRARPCPPFCHRTRESPRALLLRCGRPRQGAPGRPVAERRLSPDVAGQRSQRPHRTDLAVVRLRHLTALSRRRPADGDSEQSTGATRREEAHTEDSECCPGRGGFTDLSDLSDLPRLSPPEIERQPGISRRFTRPFWDRTCASFSSTVSRTSFPARILRVVLASGPPHRSRSLGVQPRACRASFSHAARLSRIVLLLSSHSWGLGTVCSRV